MSSARVFVSISVPYNNLCRREGAETVKTWLIGTACFVVGLIVFPLAALLYLDYGRPPVVVGDSSFPFERQITGALLHRRMAAEMTQAPIRATDQSLQEGAVTYKEQCAFCHGLPNHAAEVGKNMFPSAPQLWATHRNGVVGVSDDPVGETFWRVKNGIRLTGMPSYKNTLTESQMWEVSQLLASAAGPLPGSVRAALESTK